MVLAIMGILAASVPAIALSGLNGIRLSGKVQQVICRLNAAHEQAMETGQTVTLSLPHLAAMADATVLPASLPEVRFFPDGSAAGSDFTLAYAGHTQLLVIDGITGRVGIVSSN